uniref:ABC transporter transmembrane domain-containing protein n=1 Tax=Sinomonas sp. G460-2 TaxID=3393464 RepID=UPI0039EE3120
MSAADGGLPPLLGNGRTALLGGLVLSGAGLAVASAGVAHLISQLDRIPDTWGRILFVALLAVLVGVVASLRILERVLAEKLGQNYVQEIRLIVLRSALAGTRGPSLAITVARTTNDLNSVRNWMTYGVSALAVGIPLILALVVALWILSPVLAPTILLPMVLLSTLLGLLVGPAYRRSRALRKQRGRLAAQIGDSLAAALAIRAGGGEERELRRLEE